MNEFFLDQTQERQDLLVESPMDRYECCQHCRGAACPRHDGHADPCRSCAYGGCPTGTQRLGEPSKDPEVEAGLRSLRAGAGWQP